MPSSPGPLPVGAFAPRGHDDERESFEVYAARVGSLAPNMPSDVLEQWLHRHFHCIGHLYGWLQFERLRFRAAEWTTEELLERVKSWPDDDGTEAPRWAFATRTPFRTTGLATWMEREGTWPRPILVLENTQRLALPNGLRLAEPLHLLEGHRRFGILRALVEERTGVVRATHPLWLVTPDPLPPPAASRPG